MGRKTLESIGKALPGRTNVVITRQKDFKPSGCRVAHSWEEALRPCQNEEEIFVIGGASIFQEALPKADRIYLTQIHQDFEGDTFLKLDLSAWKEVSREDFPPGTDHSFPYSFLTLAR